MIDLKKAQQKIFDEVIDKSKRRNKPVVRFSDEEESKIFVKYMNNVITKAIDLSFQKAHDLARQEFEKEKKEFCYDYQKSHLDCVIKARGQERLSFAQKLEEIFDEIEEKANEFYFDGWEDFKKQKIDSIRGGKK